LFDSSSAIDALLKKTDKAAQRKTRGIVFIHTSCLIG
jgi:hypothetical protein